MHRFTILQQCICSGHCHNDFLQLGLAAWESAQSFFLRCLWSGDLEQNFVKKQYFVSIEFCFICLVHYQQERYRRCLAHTWKTMRLCHPPDGSTSPKYKLLYFITTKFFCKEMNALAFNPDRFCHLVLCLWLIPFHFSSED
jgi:hypothetical protein